VKELDKVNTILSNADIIFNCIETRLHQNIRHNSVNLIKYCLRALLRIEPKNNVTPIHHLSKEKNVLETVNVHLSRIFILIVWWRVCCIHKGYPEFITLNFFL